MIKLNPLWDTSMFEVKLENKTLGEFYKESDGKYVFVADEEITVSFTSQMLNFIAEKLDELNR